MSTTPATTTPGPWSIVKLKAPRLAIRFANRTVATIAAHSYADEANARLIAAAPELLDALRAVIADPYGCSLCDSGKPRKAVKGHQPDCPYEMAKAAITKAEA